MLAQYRYMCPTRRIPVPIRGAYRPLSTFIYLVSVASAAGQVAQLLLQPLQLCLMPPVGRKTSGDDSGVEWAHRRF